MKIKLLIVASTIAFSNATAANAADTMVNHELIPAIAASALSWSGAYVGGQAGYGWGNSRLGDGPGLFFLKPDSFLGSPYAGYNFDTGNKIVLGVDGDVTFDNQKDSISDGNDLFIATLESKLRWSRAVRARAGVAVDRFLPYIAGGVALGSVKNLAILSDGVDSRSASASKTLTGWKLGGGVDYIETDDLILRLEYRYTDYGKRTSAQTMMALGSIVIAVS